MCGQPFVSESLPTILPAAPLAPEYLQHGVLAWTLTQKRGTMQWATGGRNEYDTDAE